MECLKCGAALGREDFCPACGANVKLFKKIVHTSNSLYNEALERARVRDLSGAAVCLRNSLKFYKMNTNARNLLGLIYFEMGDTVDAISEWVISRSLNPEQNPAEKYLASVQTHGNKLDTLNQTIKKYNQALMYCRQGSKDLAVIQLKKVLTLNPRLVKAHQLLALLYMEEEKYDLAKKSLRNAGRIDANNTTTLRYLREVNHRLHGEQPSRKNSRLEKEELVSYRSGNETIIHPASFKESSPWTTILNIVLGVVIGVLITWFLVVPGVKQRAVSEANQGVREANDTISTKNQTINTLEKQVEDLQKQIQQMEGQKSDSENTIQVYEQLLAAYEAYVGEDYITAGVAMEQVDESQLSENAAQIFQNIAEQVNGEYLESLYQQGDAAYQQRNDTEAMDYLKRVVDLDEEYKDCDALYYLGQVYRRLDMDAEAVSCFERFLELRPGTERAENATRFLAEMKPDETE